MSGRPWTPEDDIMLRAMCAESKTVDEMMAALDRSEQSVRTRCGELKLAYGSRKWPPARQRAFQEAVGRRASFEELHETFGLQRNAILHRISVMGLPLPEWRKRPTTTPDGFIEQALRSTGAQLSDRFGFSEFVVRRLLKELTDEQRAERKRFISQQQAEKHRAFEVAKRAGKPSRKERDEARRIATAKRLEERRTMPTDFPTNYLAMNQRQLQEHYKRSGGEISAFVKQLDPSLRAAKKEQYRASQAAAYVARREAGLVRKPSYKPRQKKPGTVSGVNWGFHKPTAAADLPGGIGQRAVDFLKRHFKPAFNGERVYGKAWAGIFVVGSRQLKTDEVVALAREHGFEPDSWRAVVPPAGEARA